MVRAFLNQRSATQHARYRHPLLLPIFHLERVRLKTFRTFQRVSHCILQCIDITRLVAARPVAHAFSKMCSRTVSLFLEHRKPIGICLPLLRVSELSTAELILQMPISENDALSSPRNSHTIWAGPRSTPKAGFVVRLADEL